MRSILGLVLLVGGGLSVAGADEPVRTIPYDRYLDRLVGGWAGQMIGVSYGSVYEFQALGQTIDGPIREWKAEFVDNTIDQDDLYVEMTFLETLQKHGIEPTAEQVGADFRDSKYELWHANKAGRVNLRAGIMPPKSGHPLYNPHSDDIDFQIESDLFGLIAPGMFAESARLCDRFGSIMNYGDGLYGGRFTAAMYARAYLEEGPTPAAIERCVRAGLAAIPGESRYAMLIRDVLAAHEHDAKDWKAAWKRIEDKWAREDRCPAGLDKPFNIDAKVNGGYVVIGLLYGAGDFERTMELAMRCGQDADCNPSTAAGVLGALTGYEGIPPRFRAGIPALTGRNFAFTNYDFPRLLAACEQVTAQLVTHAGGRIGTVEGRKVIVVPVVEPTAPAQLEQLSTYSVEEQAKAREEYDKRAGQFGDKKKE